MVYPIKEEGTECRAATMVTAEKVCRGMRRYLEFLLDAYGTTLMMKKQELDGY